MLDMQSSPPDLPTPPSDINREILEFGKEVFKRVGKEQPSTFNKNFWSGRIMEWSMKKPDFKVNMFRLVDVLPTLPDSAAVATHITEYLGEVGAEMNLLFKWGLNVNPNSIRAKLTSFGVKRGVEQMAAQFIAGESPNHALSALKKIRKRGLAFTADLLGEFSVSEREATAYLERYLEALDVFGREIPSWSSAQPLVAGHPGESTPVCISVKLSALYSQTNVLNFDRSVQVLSERLATIAAKAKKCKALIYVDAEDTASNQIIYEAFEAVFGSREFRDFPYPGIVLQAYAKDSEARLLQLIEFAKSRANPIAVRLVKGAYWDHETIGAKQNNWESPLWSKKESSDANFEKLTRILIDNRADVLPALASHNIRSLSHACCYARAKGLKPSDFELQMLFGMADPIASAFASLGYLVRLYVPLGEMLPGMGYLVRRLLENTSNESFLRHTFVDADQVEELLVEPMLKD